MKRTWRILSYAIGLLAVAREARPFHVELAIDGAPPWSGEVYQVSIGNGRFRGGGLTVAEHAAIDDGTLHLYVVLPGTFWQLLACISHLKFGFAEPDVLRGRAPDTCRSAHGDLGRSMPMARQPLRRPRNSPYFPKD